MQMLYGLVLPPRPSSPSASRPVPPYDRVPQVTALASVSALPPNREWARCTGLPPDERKRACTNSLDTSRAACVPKEAVLSGSDELQLILRHLAWPWGLGARRLRLVACVSRTWREVARCVLDISAVLVEQPSAEHISTVIEPDGLFGSPNIVADALNRMAGRSESGHETSGDLAIMAGVDEEEEAEEEEGGAGKNDVRALAILPDGSICVAFGTQLMVRSANGEVLRPLEAMASNRADGILHHSASPQGRVNSRGLVVTGVACDGASGEDSSALRLLRGCAGGLLRGCAGGAHRWSAAANVR